MSRVDPTSGPAAADAPSLAEVHASLTGPGAPFEIAEARIRGVRTRIWKNEPPSPAPGQGSQTAQLVSVPFFHATGCHTVLVGATAAPDLVRRIRQAFPAVSPGNGYGLTETSSITTFNIGADYVARPDSVGVPVPVCELRVVDDKGFVTVVDRAKDMLIRGGENVYCVEVESVLYDHPEVMDAAAASPCRATRTARS